MDLRTAIEHLRADLQRFADHPNARPGAIGFKRQVLNTVINEFDRLLSYELELEAQLSLAVGRATYAEGTADILMEWCVLHGIDYRRCLDLNDDAGLADQVGTGRALSVFRAARAELMRSLVAQDQHQMVFTPSVERSRLAHYLILKHATPSAFPRYQDAMESNANSAVKEAATA